MARSIVAEESTVSEQSKQLPKMHEAIDKHSRNQKTESRCQNNLVGLNVLHVDEHRRACNRQRSGVLFEIEPEQYNGSGNGNDEQGAKPMHDCT